jgi:hypothetical protein
MLPAGNAHNLGPAKAGPLTARRERSGFGGRRRYLPRVAAARHGFGGARGLAITAAAIAASARLTPPVGMQSATQPDVLERRAPVARCASGGRTSCTRRALDHWRLARLASLSSAHGACGGRKALRFSPPTRGWRGACMKLPSPSARDDGRSAANGTVSCRHGRGWNRRSSGRARPRAVPLPGSGEVANASASAADREMRRGVVIG